MLCFTTRRYLVDLLVSRYRRYHQHPDFCDVRDEDRGGIPYSSSWVVSVRLVSKALFQYRSTEKMAPENSFVCDIWDKID